MAGNPGYAQVDTPFGRVGLLEAYAPDITLLHAPVADRRGNLAFQPPGLEGVWGALAARRGVVATVDRVVDDIRPWSHLVQVPAHRVLAVAETPLGAHPGGLFARDVPVDPYGEDLEFWTEARAASHGDGYDRWIEEWVLGPADQDEYLARLGPVRIAGLRRRAEPDSWRDDEAAHPPDLTAEPAAWEIAAVHGARYLADRVVALDADAVLAGAGVANLAAWLAVDLARDRGSRRRAGGGARAVGLPAHTGRPLHLQSPQLPDGHHAGRRRAGPRRPGRRPRHDVAGLPGGRPDRPARQHQLHRDR